MAVFNSPFTFTGKVGNVVGAKGPNGKTIVRPHTSPSQPNTKKQVEVRTKLALAGLLSKITPQDAIVGLNGSRRQRRNRFMRLNINEALIDPNADQVKAYIPMNKLTFSEGNMLAIPAAALSATKGADSTAFKAVLSNFPEDIDLVQVIFVGSRDNVYVTVQSQIASPDNAEVTFNSLADQGNFYLVPITAADGVDNVTYGNVVDRIENGDYSAFADRDLNTALKMNQSIYAGSTQVTRP